MIRKVRSRVFFGRNKAQDLHKIRVSEWSLTLNTVRDDIFQKVPADSKPLQSLKLKSVRCSPEVRHGEAEIVI